MAAKYNLFKNPPKGNKSEQETFHARIVPGRTIQTEQLARELATMSSVSTGDVISVLDNLSYMISVHLKEGNIVNLDKIGHFSISVSSPKQLTGDRKIRSASVRFKKVNFRCVNEFKQKFVSMTMKREPSGNENPLTPQQRQQRILDFLAKETSITSTQCITLNGCTRYAAIKDLKTLTEASKVKRLGVAKSIIYILP